MKILFIGDIVGRPGREAVKALLPKLKKNYKPDFTLANGENLASGKGVTPKIYEEMIVSGIDLLTGGNHILKRPEVLTIIDSPSVKLIRPANWPKEQPGKTFIELKKNGDELLVINLEGQVYMEEPAESPFVEAEKIINRRKCKYTLVDFHAEATSEKRALAEYLDGRVGAVLGTHTHVTTADEKILPHGTGFITDIGMTGTIDSILGVKKELVIERFLSGEKKVFEVADGTVELNAVYLELNNKGLARKIERVREKH
ncbi:MAG TPA: TIGR00282 family metallophosphoesterase [Patescibacteria group bacterium]|nr:TIGR00282 family metallophosphoesterase [Patescibacteria group bacterium]